MLNIYLNTAGFSCLLDCFRKLLAENYIKFSLFAASFSILACICQLRRYRSARHTIACSTFQGFEMETDLGAILSRSSR